MSNLTQWFAMNGYAIYIWPAYGLVFGVLITSFVRAKRQGKRTQNLLRQGLDRL